MVIFHSYVKLPEGNFNVPMYQASNLALKYSAPGLLPLRAPGSVNSFFLLHMASTDMGWHGMTWDDISTNKTEELVMFKSSSWFIQKYGFVWKCWVYSQWNSHLIGIMISKTIGFKATLFSDKPIWFPRSAGHWSLGLRHGHRKTWSKPADLSTASRSAQRWSTTADLPKWTLHRSLVRSHSNRWLTYPPENIWVRQIGSSSPIWWGKMKKNVTNHHPDFKLSTKLLWQYSLPWAHSQPPTQSNSHSPKVHPDSPAHHPVNDVGVERLDFFSRSCAAAALWPLQTLGPATIP